MIVSITLRHDRANEVFRRRVKTECLSLRKWMSGITRVNVVFSNETHKHDPYDIISCHISLQAVGKQHIDIYVREACENAAFDRALECITAKLLRTNACHLRLHNREMLYETGAMR